MYDAWGRPIKKTGSFVNSLGMVQPFRYRGYVYDEETGMYYLRSRYYNANQCRFVNADVLYYKNLFAYCKSEPVKYIDRNGFAPGVSFNEMGFGNSMAHLTGGGCHSGSGRAWETATYAGFANTPCNDDGAADEIAEDLDNACIAIIGTSIVIGLSYLVKPVATAFFNEALAVYGADVAYGVSIITYSSFGILVEGTKGYVYAKLKNAEIEQSDMGSIFFDAIIEQIPINFPLFFEVLETFVTEYSAQ